MELTSSNAPVNTAYVPRLLEIEGVEAAVPVIRNISPAPDERWGIRQVDGVDWEPFAEMNDMEIVEGRAPASLQEVILDERQIRSENRAVGETLELFGRNYDIVGVFAPPSGSRIKMSLGAMQNALEIRDKCTYILVKVRDGAVPSEVASRINAELPGNKVNLTEELIIDARDRVPGLNTFLQVLVGLGAFVSTIFVLLSMYTTITERRKEIGILKSLGASKRLIISVIEGEALVIGILGIVAGLVLSAGAAALVQFVYELKFEFSAGWIATAALIAVGGSLVGALYPAWRASLLDPVLVLANE